MVQTRKKGFTLIELIIGITILALLAVGLLAALDPAERDVYKRQIPRLIDLGAEPFLISSVLVASIAQRIARKICERCKIQYKPPPELQQQVSQTIFGKSVERTDSITLYKGTGCDACDHTGYHGRIGLFEVLTVSAAVNKLILQHSSAETIEAQAVADGMLTMRQDGYLKALSGYTTLEEVIRLTDVK